VGSAEALPQERFREGVDLEGDLDAMDSLHARHGAA